MVDVGTHSRHDRFAIADALGGGALPSAVRTCPACGALHRDLLSIQIAIRHTWTPRRPRDLRLRSTDLDLGPPMIWWRLIDAIGSSRDTVTRPLAIGLTGIGIVGLILTNVSFGTAVGFGGVAPAGASPEIGAPASRPYVATAVDHPVDQATRDPGPLALVTAASLGAGGTILGLRRVASRHRRLR